MKKIRQMGSRFRIGRPIGLTFCISALAQGSLSPAGMVPYLLPMPTNAVASSGGYTNVANGLLAWWKLNDGTGASAADSSGNGNTAALVGTPTWGTGDLTLNGTSQYVNTTDGNSIKGLAAYSLCFWIDGPLNNANGSDLWCEHNNSGSETRFEIYVNYPAPFTLWVDGSSTDAASTAWITATTSAIPANTWTHVAVTVDLTAGKVLVYFNGSQDATTGTVSGTTFVGTNPQVVPCLGNDPDGGGYYLPATLCQARVYNRALTATEINDLFHYDAHP